LAFSKPMWAKLASKKTEEVPITHKLKVVSTLPPSLQEPSAKPAVIIPKPFSHADGTIRVVVLDSGAFISKTNFYEFLTHDVLYYTTQSVVDEVRDPASRQFLRNFPFPLKIKTPSQKSIRAVTAFCKKTKDLDSLSFQDKQIIALAYELERYHHGTTHLNSEPPTQVGLDDDRVNALVSKPKPSIPLRLTRQVVPFDLNDFFSLSPQQYERKHECKLPRIETAEERLETSHSTSTTSRSKGISRKDLDRSFTTGEWITPTNFARRQRGYVENMTEEEQLALSSVGCITVDYHMQNAMIQMGLRIISLNGKSIRNIRYWIKRCLGCFTFISDTSAMFCPKCGQQTLQRAFVKVTEDGRRIYKFSKRDLSLRGKIFSYPKRKGGRGNKDLILAEDEWKQAIRKAPKVTKFNKVGSLERTTLDFDEKGRIKVLPVVGYGRRNPNVVKRTGKRRRKKAR